MLRENKNALLSRVWTPKAGDIVQVRLEVHTTALQNKQAIGVQQDQPVYNSSTHSGDRGRGCQQNAFKATREDLMTSKQTPQNKITWYFLIPWIRKPCWMNPEKGGLIPSTENRPRQREAPVPQLVWENVTVSLEHEYLWCRRQWFQKPVHTLKLWTQRSQRSTPEQTGKVWAEEKGLLSHCSPI